MLLKRIAEHLPPYLQELLPALDSAGLKTTENLIFTPETQLRSLVPGIPAHLLEELVDHCIELTAPSAVNGDEALAQTYTSPETYRTAENPSSTLENTSWDGWGTEGLDGLLEEWDGRGILEISGPRRVGKSLLALHVILRALVNDPQAACIWIDTSGSFDPGRAKAILQALKVEDEDVVLDRLNILPCFSLEPDIYDAVQKIQSELSSSQAGGKPRTKLVVLDQITTLFKDMLMPSTAQGHAAMISLMTDLGELTYQYGLTTIVTNGSASSLPVNPLSNFSATTIKPALGTAYSYCVDISLLVQETGKVFGMVDEEERERVRKKPGLRGVVEVLKSRYSPAGRWAVFETDGTTLYDVVAPPLEDERTIRMSAGLPVGEQRPLYGPLAETLVP